MGKIVTIPFASSMGGDAYETTEDIHPRFVRAPNSGDIDATMALYETRTGRLVPQPVPSCTRSRFAYQPSLRLICCRWVDGCRIHFCLSSDGPCAHSLQPLVAATMLAALYSLVGHPGHAGNRLKLHAYFRPYRGGSASASSLTLASGCMQSERTLLGGIGRVSVCRSSVLTLTERPATRREIQNALREKIGRQQSRHCYFPFLAHTPFRFHVAPCSCCGLVWVRFRRGSMMVPS